jgi:hypothetical protein
MRYSKKVTVFDGFSKPPLFPFLPPDINLPPCAVFQQENQTTPISVSSTGYKLAGLCRFPTGKPNQPYFRFFHRI